MMANRLAIALQEDGWWVRSEIVWAKPNAMPDSSGKYRPSSSHEKVFMLSRSGTCFYDYEAVARPVSGNTHRRVPKNHKKPDDWDTGTGAHGRFHRHGREKGQRPGIGPKTANEASLIKAKESFHASTTDLVDTRYCRNYEPAPPVVWVIQSEGFF